MSAKSTSIYIANHELETNIEGTTDLEPLVHELRSSGMQIVREDFPVQLYMEFGNYDLIIVHRTWLRLGRLLKVNNEHPEVPMIALRGLENNKDISIDACLRTMTNGYYRLDKPSLESTLQFVNYLIKEKRKKEQAYVISHSSAAVSVSGAE